MSVRVWNAGRYFVHRLNKKRRESEQVNDGVTGESNEVITSGLISYSSTIDSISNLKLKYSYDDGYTNLPIVVLMHGYNQEISHFDAAVFTRFAGYKFFTVAVGMRGRDSASGSRDSSARELYDIIDAVEYIKTNFPGVVNPNKINIVGYSGGGGNALGVAMKFPDYFNVAVSHFGMSDYGEDATFGWYNQVDSTQKTNIEGQIGGSPTTFPDRYKARNHENAAKNFKNGFLYLFHDQDDASVNVSQSQRVADKYVTEGNTNYALSITTSVDSPRWTHGLPNTGQAVINTEPIWKDLILTRTSWTIPTSGEIEVRGYIETKLFTIWLGTGIDEAATVVYNTTTKAYTVTPLTGSMEVTIKQGADTKTRTISSESIFTLGIFEVLDLSPSVWFDADDEGTVIRNESLLVSQWGDKSGNNRHATQSDNSLKPEWRELTKAIGWDGALRYLTHPVPVANPSQLSVFIVTEYKNTGDYYWWAHRSESTRLIQCASFAGSHPNNPLLALRGSGNVAQFLQAGVTQNDTRVIYRMQFDKTNDLHEVQVNNNAAVQNTYDFGSETFNSTINSIGAANTGSGFINPFNGRIHEIIIFSRVLTSQEKTDLRNYLNSKWSVF